MKTVKGVDVTIDLVASVLLFALGLWVLDVLGIEQWVADEIGNFVRLIVAASRS